MTCTQVLDLIDAEGLVDDAAARLDAARRHAGQCSACGAAWQAAAVLMGDLTTLAHPAPPRDLTRSVMARIVRIEELRAPVTALRGERETPMIVDWSVWATVLGALASAVVAGGVEDAPQSTVRTLAFAAALLLYLAGLFSPIDRATSTARSPS